MQGPARKSTLRLIGEGAVVVLSILIAFGVDAWWEYFGERVREQEAIEQLVDRVEIGVIPKILGQGIPLVPGLANIARLELHSSELFPKSGIALLKYDVMDSDRTLAEG